MAKARRARIKKETNEQASPVMEPVQPEPLTLAGLRSDHVLWYKTCVLVHDLANLKNNVSSAKRLDSTLDPLYISVPYFTNEEADRVKAATIADDKTTIEQAINSKLENFFEKRKASGDARPCGPHDMAPVFMDVFNIEKQVLEDESFKSRVKRGGLST